MRRSRILGDRSIRSAGRSSGSVEITLPVCLMDLQGVTCRVELRDGLSPEVVLKPEMGGLLPVFEATWDLLSLALKTIGEICEFWEGDYVLGLFPESGFSGRPGLAYADALIVQRELPRGARIEAAGKDRAFEAFARMIEGMATVAGGRLGLLAENAPSFGNHLAYAVTGVTTGAVDPFARGLLMDDPSHVEWSRDDDVWAEQHWIAAQTRLENLYDRCKAWDREPDLYTKQRQLWYRARRFEARVRSE